MKGVSGSSSARVDEDFGSIVGFLAFGFYFSIFDSLEAPFSLSSKVPAYTIDVIMARVEWAQVARPI